MPLSLCVCVCAWPFFFFSCTPSRPHSLSLSLSHTPFPSPSYIRARTHIQRYIYIDINTLTHPSFPRAEPLIGLPIHPPSPVQRKQGCCNAAGQKEKRVADCFGPWQAGSHWQAVKIAPLFPIGILALCPWTPEGITATTQLPARRRGSLHLLKDAAALVLSSLRANCC